MRPWPGSPDRLSVGCLTSDCAGTNARGSQRVVKRRRRADECGPPALFPAVWTRVGIRLVMCRSGRAKLRTRPCNALVGSGPQHRFWPLHERDADCRARGASCRQRSLEPRRGAARVPSCCGRLPEPRVRPACGSLSAGRGDLADRSWIRSARQILLISRRDHRGELRRRDARQGINLAPSFAWRWRRPDHGSHGKIRLSLKL
jgi:hypothetical protein